MIGHGILKALLKRLLNDWFGRFYDLAGAAAEAGSGESGLAQGRARVTELLLQLGLICLPNVLVHPLFKFIANQWVLQWRLALVKSYLSRWQLDQPRLENAAQRAHEDTARFARGLQEFAVILLDAVLTLVVFSPILVDLGSRAKPNPRLFDAWLLVVSVAVAVVGVGGSFAFGHMLVGLEVKNQKVEADLRRKLVFLEDDVSAVVPSISDGEGALVAFRGEVNGLRSNYKRLYRAFAVFSLWLGGFEQAIVILPYLLVAPLLYAEHESSKVSLGVLSQTANAFGVVFSSLNTLSDNWISVTEFCSVVRRLREFERKQADSPNEAILPAEIEISI